MSEKRDLYQTVTDAIVKQLESGAGAFIKPWVGADMPTNGTSGHEYRGVNVLMLWASAAAGGFKANAWASYKQWQAAGAQVRAGERGTMIVYAGTAIARETVEASEGEEGGRTFRFLKYSHVFNSDQVDGFELKAAERPNLAQRLEAAEAFVANTGAVIKYSGERACYVPSRDEVHMPAWEAFTDTPTATATERAYGVLFHELTHWTGHEKRLAREFGKRFGNEAYAAEELVAELGAAFTAARLGIECEPRADHAQYLASWLTVLRNDKKAIFTAAARASDAADYLAKTTVPLRLAA